MKPPTRPAHRKTSEPQFVTLSRLASELGLARCVVDRFVRLGKITPALSVAGTVRYITENVLEQLEAETSRNLGETRKANRKLSRYL